MPSNNPYAAGCAWIDGEFVPIGEARIPILDTGFTRSDLTYDVAAVWQRGSSGSMTISIVWSAAAIASGCDSRSPRKRFATS